MDLETFKQPIAFHGAMVSNVRVLCEGNIKFGLTFTGRELITDFARIRGISADQATRLASNIISEVGLDLKADNRCATYSGGNKRKLSLALSMVANPVTVLLDEPTTGIDPASRRQIWSFIANKTQRSRHGVILTTHSMEEADALCNRIGENQILRLPSVPVHAIFCPRPLNPAHHHLDLILFVCSYHGARICTYSRVTTRAEDTLWWRGVLAARNRISGRRRSLTSPSYRHVHRT